MNSLNVNKISFVYWFCIVVQYAVLIYTVVGWLKFLSKFQITMANVMDPILNPIRKMLRYSVFQIHGIDISPIILYLIASYVANLCLVLR